MPTISIVIPHYGAEELLQACLASISKHTLPSVEVVVVDNGTRHPISADQVIRNPDNLGFAAACNQGAAAATGEILVFLNNDCEVQGGWLEPLVAHLERGVGIAGSLLLHPDGSVAHAGIALHRDQFGHLVAVNRTGQYAQSLVEAVTGACLAIHKGLFFRLGGFDEGYMNGYEDVDLCLTARKAGWPIIYDPASVVTHLESQSGPARWAHVRQNVARLQDKWGNWDG